MRYPTVEMLLSIYGYPNITNWKLPLVAHPNRLGHDDSNFGTVAPGSDPVQHSGHSRGGPPVTTLARNISSWLIIATVVATSGTVGTTVAFQDSAQDIQTENEDLRAENEELREQLNETREERQAEKSRAEELNKQLETRNEDVEILVLELERKEKMLNASQARLAESRENQAGMPRSEMEKRLDYLCAQPENIDRFGCQEFGPDE